MKRWNWSWLLLVLAACSSNPSNPASPGPAGGSIIPTRKGLWSDPKSWPSGKVPQAGESPTIPADLAMTLDVSPPPLNGLTINGQLKFDDIDLKLSTQWIMVHGRLEVGTEESPYTKRAEIVLTGSDSSQNIMGMGGKTIGVMEGGVLELHGETRQTWMHLSATAPKGATQISVEDANDWRVGDQVVLASTDYNGAQAEVRNITGKNGNTLQLNAALKYTHFGEVSFGVDQRGEVGLLSHNIYIHGDNTSSVTGFGGHLMTMKGGWMRIAGVEFAQMGQAQKMGRYPVHWHLAGDVSGQYIKDSAIHDTYNRCITVHGTHNAEVSGNVAYNATGHCYFLEDGIETKNKIVGNLGILAKPPAKGKEVIPSDSEAAVFWITNPDNTLTDNVAAGGGNGFWYAFPEHPTGLSKTATTDRSIFPRRTPLGLFSDNIAHSNYQGLMVDRGPDANGVPTSNAYYNPRSNPVPPTGDAEDSAPVVAVFSNFTGYKNRGNAVWLRGENQKVTGAKLSDNAIGVTFAAQDVSLEDSLIVGDSANKGTPESWEAKGADGRTLPRPWNDEVRFPIRGFEFYDGPNGFKNVQFANFQPLALADGTTREAGALSYLHFTVFAIDSRNFASGAQFTNARPVYLEAKPEPTATEIADDDTADSYRNAVFVDQDGSVGGKAGASVVINHPFLVDTNCAAKVEWNAQVCNNPYGRLLIEDVSREANQAPVTFTRLEGSNPSFRVWGAPSSGNNHWFYATVISGRSYSVAFGNSSPAHLRIHLQNRKPGDTLKLALPYNANPSIYGDWWVDNRNRMGAAASMAELDSSTGNKYFYSGGTLYLKFVIKNVADRDSATIDVCRNDLCK